MRKYAVPAFVVLLGLTLAAFIATSKPEPARVEVALSPPPQVTVLRAEPHVGQVAIRSQGTVQPRRQIELVAQVGGVVTAVGPAFNVGGAFEAGDVLLRVDPRDYENAVAQAQATLADARQVLATERAQSRQAEREWRDLGNDDANELFLRVPQLASAKARVAAAQADLNQAQLNLERTTIRAPFAGRLLTLAANLGQFVPAGAPVATIFDSQLAELALPLTSRQRAMLDPAALAAGLPIQVLVSVGDHVATRDAVVTRTASQIDATTRMLDLLAEIPSPLQGATPLLPGQFVQADIPSRNFERLMRLPRQALRAGDTLWTLDAENHLQVLAVEILQADGSEVIVQAPTATALTVVTSALALADEGMLLAPTVQTAEDES